MERTIRSWVGGLDVEVHFNNGDPTISGGRNYQLNLVKSPLVCFVDDDITVHGDAFLTVEEAMRRIPAGLVGLRSYREDTDELFKPRDSTPHVITPEFRYQPVHGMLVASYTNLLRDVGGFNPRRRFWGEWTELNLRMWRSGFPSGHVMTGGYLRHWEKAPDSPTRNMDGRAKHVLWGLICTALEYDAVDMSQATETFWRLVQERYLAYSFGEELSHQELLRATLELVPDLSAEWAAITAFRSHVAEHRSISSRSSPSPKRTCSACCRARAASCVAIDGWRGPGERPPGSSGRSSAGCWCDHRDWSLSPRTKKRGHPLDAPACIRPLRARRRDPSDDRRFRPRAAGATPGHAAGGSAPG